MLNIYKRFDNKELYLYFTKNNKFLFDLDIKIKDKVIFTFTWRHSVDVIKKEDTIYLDCMKNKTTLECITEFEYDRKDKIRDSYKDFIKRVPRLRYIRRLNRFLELFNIFYKKKLDY